MATSVFFVFIVVILATAECFPKLRNITSLPVEDLTEESVGSPLFITSLLGDYKNAQAQSKVVPDIGNTTSYSGLFTVNKECDSNIFFWFFPAQKDNWEDAPLLLWLQGGPGTPSLMGLFEELGPFEYYEEGLRKRQYSWNVENNLLIIDQPVGTGYSFTGNSSCYPDNSAAMGEDLYQAVLQFHQLFPGFTKNRFIISGESYAGHFLTALGRAIHQYNPTAEVKINLTTIMIGNGWFDPLTQSDYATYLEQLGLIDKKQKSLYKQYQKQLYEELADGSWEIAKETSDALMGSIFQGIVQDVSVYNYYPQPIVTPNWPQFMQSSSTRKALHVGRLPFLNGDDLRDKLGLDDVQSVKPWVEELLENYPIVFYNGQMDIICAYPMMITFLRSLEWSGEKTYRSANRSAWCLGDCSLNTRAYPTVNSVNMTKDYAIYAVAGRLR